MERADLNVIQYVARVTPLFWVVVGLAVARTSRCVHPKGDIPNAKGGIPSEKRRQVSRTA
jgi:hypothetical protein